jgi:mono/diheme cytochrome c family protein
MKKISLILSLAWLGSRSLFAADPAANTNAVPTYLADVRPILMGNCSRCHNQSSQFLYNWLDYRTAYHDRGEIKRRVWDSWNGDYYKEMMPVENSPESLAISEADRRTIKRWVENGAPMGVEPVAAGDLTKPERIQAGKKLFNSICAACHQATGQGRPNVFPPLAGSDYLNADKNRAIQLVLFGRQGEVLVNGMKYNNNMPSFPLSDADIANVLTYVYNSFGNSGLEVNPAEVKALRAAPPKVETAPARKSDFE